MIHHTAADIIHSPGIKFIKLKLCFIVPGYAFFYDISVYFLLSLLQFFNLFSLTNDRRIILGLHLLGKKNLKGIPRL